MKKVIIFSVAVCFAMNSIGQTLDDVNALMGKNKYSEAKVAIDKYMADPKTATDPKAWFFKGTVYNNYSNDSSIAPAMAYDLKVKAFEAYKKTQEVDKTDMYMKLDLYRPYLYVYSGFYNLGAAQFNAKDFTGAYNSFTRANEVEDFILNKKYVYDNVKMNRLDTALLLNTAAAARNANNPAAAVNIYRKFTDANVAGKDMEDVYVFLVTYYRNNKDEKSMNDMIAKGKAAYPNNRVWTDLEIDALSTGGNKDALFKKYDDIFIKDPADFASAYNYAIELYNSLYSKDSVNGSPANASARLTEVLKTSIPNDKSGVDALMLLTNHLYNVAADYTSKALAIKGTKPEDVKRKKELNALANAKMDEVIPYAEAVLKHYADVPPTKTSQKVNLKNAANYLSDIYTLKNNTKKAAEYDKTVSDIKF